MGKVEARAIEALVGGGLGAASLAGIGALTHAPKTPTEWLGEDGKFHSRNLTPAEKKNRNKKLLLAALIGAGAGSAGSVGASALRRNLLAADEANLVPKLMDERLGGLRKIVANRVKEVEKASKLKGSEELTRRESLAAQAKSLLDEQEKKISSLAEAAKEERAGKPWGGFRLTGAGPTPVPHEKLTLEGQAERYYRDLQKKNDLPPMISPYDRGAVGEQFFKRLLEKKAVSNALLDELLSIEKGANVTPSILGRIQAAARKLMGQASPTQPKTVDEIMGITPRIQIDSEGVIYNKGKPVGLNATIASQRRHFPPGSRGAA